MDTRARKPVGKTLFGMPPGALYWKAIDPIWDKVSIHDGPAVYLRQLSKVRREQGLLMAAHWCMSEVCNGGFNQFFVNSTGVLAPEAAEGFRMIRARTLVKIISRAMARLGSPYPRDREERGRALRKIRKPGRKREQWDPFLALDEKVYAWDGHGKFEESADQFVRRNLTLFFR